MDITQGFLAFVNTNRESDCWMWTGARMRGEGSYGRFRNRLAHRVAWELFKGPIPFGLYVLHRCDNPPCVNPEHLFLGTQQDNMDDAHQKGRGGPWERRWEASDGFGWDDADYAGPEYVRVLSW